MSTKGPSANAKNAAPPPDDDTLNAQARPGEVVQPEAKSGAYVIKANENGLRQKTEMKKAKISNKNDLFG